MRESPPPSLVDLLAELGVATAHDLRAVYPRAKRLARDLPLFESVWIDALVQARLLSLHQASEIHAGRGRDLAVGPYVVIERVESLGSLTTFRARHRTSGNLVRLLVARVVGADAAEIAARLAASVERSGLVESRSIARLEEADCSGAHAWGATRWVDGVAAAPWVAQRGRFAPLAVLEIARQMTAALASLESLGMRHGDISLRGLVIQRDATVVLAPPGFRSAIRPAEGYTSADLPPEAYDTLAPERITTGQGPTVASDIYACGAVWWHLLAGRAPFVGADGLAKLRAIQTSRLVDVSRLAPDTPAKLAEVVSRALDREPQRRPASFVEIAEMLGAPQRQGSKLVQRAMQHAVHVHRPKRFRPRMQWRRRSRAANLVAIALAMWGAAAGYSWWQGQQTGKVPGSSATGQLVQAPAAAANDIRKVPVLSAQRTSTAGPPTAREVAQVGAVRPVGLGPIGSPADATTAGEHDLVLPAGRPLRLETLSPRAGQTVCGAPGTRPCVIVPRDGLAIDVERVRFVGIDFIAETPPNRGGARAAVVKLSALQVAFQQCSFQTRGQAARAIGIACVPVVSADPDEIALPTTNLELTDCVFANLSAAVTWNRAGSLVTQWTNVLVLGPGPALSLLRAVAADEPAFIVLSHCTLRETSALLSMPAIVSGSKAGRIGIEANDCVLAPRVGGALLNLPGSAERETIFASIEWTGQGSVIAPDAPLAGCITSDGKTHAIDDDRFDASGLVRSRLEFAGAIDASPAASRIVRWQVPIRSADPPGIREGSLVLPTAP